MSGEIRRIEPPTDTLRDRLDQLGTRAVDALTGGFGSLVLDILVPSRLDERMRAFYQDIADGLDQLAVQGRIDRAQIESHEQFISNYVESVIAALRTHEAEKREMLRNAVLNSVLPDAPDAIEQHIFLLCVSDLTTLHVRVLKYFSEAKPASLGERDKLIAQFLSDEFGGAIAGDRLMRELIIRDLVAKGLLAERATPNRSWPVQMDSREKLTTPMGDRFVAFISSPC